MARISAVSVATAVLLLTLLAPAASATPTANDEGSYGVLGRVFPDPLANCQRAGSSPCSPFAQGNVPATQFIQFNEFLDSIEYMNTKPDWQRYIEVLPLDGKLGDGAGNGKGGPNNTGDVPGNNLADLEYTPDPRAVSAGLPTSTTERQKHDLIVIRVTDETVPDAGKQRYALSLSIHGIERAGVEGGTRAMEDLVTAYTTGLANQPVIDRKIDPAAPTFADVLKKSIVYFTYPNPDGWQRGSVSQGGVFFQRYGGNGVDLNRDWPDIGFSFRPYSGLSEPESRGLAKFLSQVRTKGGDFAAGDDLHGQPFADALSYTLLPHGRHRFDKDIRIRETAKTIHKNSEQRLSWSPIIQPNNAPQGGGVPCSPDVLGTACSKIYGQTWGSVYDTINYTTTGALGDYFDSSVGLNADGIDNEMSFSHIDRNIVFDPHTEQLHVDGNKALIYAHLAEIDHPAVGLFDAPGRKGYVPNERVKSDGGSLPATPPGSQPHADIDLAPTDAVPDTEGRGSTYDLGEIGGSGVFNGGMRVDVTAANVQGIGTGSADLKLQCQGCDKHRSQNPSEEAGEWITVAEDYNQAELPPVYAQAGITVAVNYPQAYQGDGKPVKWRALVSPEAGPARVHVEFTSGPATTDGSTGGDATEQRPYDVANTDYFRDLDRHVVDSAQDFDAVDPADVLAGRQSLDDFESVVLADDPLPGYTGEYGGRTRPTGPPPANRTFEGTAPTPNGGSSDDVPGSTADIPFEIPSGAAVASFTVVVRWASDVNDFDMTIYRQEANGDLTEVGSSAAGSTAFEQATVREPVPGKYIARIKNYASTDPAFNGTITFRGVRSRGAGTFSRAEMTAWARKLRDYAEGGGNLVLTDGALRILPEMTSIPDKAINRQTVYAGQTTFATAQGQPTVSDRLARNIDQPGARFNDGGRRQTFEPTPLGFAIQDVNGGDQSNAQQYDVDKAEWEKAGGRTAGTSVNAGDRDAVPVFGRVTLGELKLGKGQVRIAGALLPQPTEDFDHPLGLEPYAVTYTGYIVTRNLLDTTAKGLPGLPGSRENPAPGDKLAPGAGGSAGTGAGGRNTGRNFVISRRAVKLKKRVAAVRVSCRSITGCRGTLKLTLKQTVRGKNGKKKTKTYTLGSKTFNYKAKKRNALLRVKLASSRARIASTKRRQKVTAVGSVRFGDRTSGRTSAKFWLYRPSKGG